MTKQKLTVAAGLLLAVLCFGATTMIRLTTQVQGILPGANGGTGNGFFAVSGPSASLKTYAFPNASTTVLTTNAAVTSAQGGTGANNTATSGRYLKGDGSNFLTSSGSASGTGSCTGNKAVTALNSDAPPTCNDITPVGSVDPSTTIDIYEEFLCGSSTTATVGCMNWFFNGGGGSILYPDTNVTNAANHPGLVGLLDSTASTGWEYLYPGMHTGSTSNFDRIDTYVWYIEAGVNPQSDTGTRIFKARFGWSATIGAAQPTDGVYFQGSFPGSGTSPNWFCVVRKAGVETATDSTVAATVNSWHYLKITNDGAGTAHFYIGATKAAAAEVCAGMSMSNYPTNVSMRNPVFEMAGDTGNGTVADLVIDWFHMNFTLSR